MAALARGTFLTPRVPLFDPGGPAFAPADRDIDGLSDLNETGTCGTDPLVADTDIELTDKAMQVCPVGVILRKEVGFAVPIGERRFDRAPISAQALADAPRPPASHAEGKK